MLWNQVPSSGAIIPPEEELPGPLPLLFPETPEADVLLLVPTAEEDPPATDVAELVPADEPGALLEPAGWDVAPTEEEAPREDAAALEEPAREELVTVLLAPPWEDACPDDDEEDEDVEVSDVEVVEHAQRLQAIQPKAHARSVEPQRCMFKRIPLGEPVVWRHHNSPVRRRGVSAGWDVV